MDVEVYRDDKKYNLHFEKGENIGGLKSEPAKRKKTGTKVHWRPDLDVFTEINVSDEYFHETLKRQAVVNPNLLLYLDLKNQMEALTNINIFMKMVLQIMLMRLLRIKT